MELPGFSYLFTLALISITFTGFAALTMIFRQIVGGKLSRFDIFIVHAVLERGFMTAACAMLPPLLVLFELSHSGVWRLSSLIAAIAQATFLVAWPVRRRAAARAPIPKRNLLNYVAQWITTVFLAANATGLIPEGWAAGLFAASLTVFLLLSFVAYMLALGILLRVNGRRG